MNTSVVIATYNRRESLRRCLASVQRQTYSPLEIIVVDDASTDGTQKMVRAEFPAVRLERQQTNRGPAAARNRGLWLARADIVAFTDDDCVVPPDWLEVYCRSFEERPGIIGVGGYQEASEALIASNAVARAEHVMRLERWGDRAFHHQQGGAEVPGFGTNNVAYRRDALIAIDGFDETFPVAAGEDFDLKVRLAGAATTWSGTPAEGPFLYVPLRVRHDRVYTLRSQWHMGMQRGIGAYYFERKHGQAPGLLRVLLRGGKRTLLFLRDLGKQPVKVAVAMYLLRLGDCLGQLKMVLSSKNDRSSDEF